MYPFVQRAQRAATAEAGGGGAAHAGLPVLMAKGLYVKIAPSGTKVEIGVQEEQSLVADAPPIEVTD